MTRQQRRRIEIQNTRVQFAPRRIKPKDRAAFFHQHPRAPLAVVGHFTTRDASKYSPHQNERECARRFRQMSKAAS